MDNNCVDSKKSKQKFPEAKKLDFSDSAIDEVFRDMFADDNAVDSVGVKLDEASENKGKQIYYIKYFAQNYLCCRKM